ncbi:hypothetical protein [Pseudooceanicola nitratireducens]|uniref:hypothetical protein n=1 Tax=Pseudooceanicola nitratireducens TaxID=517719 RepID=UPI003514D1C5
METSLETTAMMLNKTLEPRAATSAEAFAAKPVLDLFRNKTSDLWHAARLLGGYDAGRIVDKCAARLDAQQRIDGQTEILLRQILGILSLEEVEDPEKSFMGFFAVIDPSDPVVAEICLLTDQLHDALALSGRRQHWAARQAHASIEA